MRKSALSIGALALLVAAAAVILPRAEHGLALRLAQDDPVRLAELRLAETFDRSTAVREIAAALDADDLELAESFAALAADRGIVLSGETARRLEAARSTRETIRRTATRFGRGFVTGEAEEIAGLAGAAAGDLLVFGDIRDLAREGTRWVRGQPVDRVMVSLAAAGLAITAGTYFATGAAGPARAGASLFKAARRSGRVGANLVADVGRLARSGRSVRALDAVADLGRIESKAGARAALEGLRHADNLGDVARVGRLAEKNGRATLAILKTLGRGALVVGAGALSGALWVMGAATNIFLLVIALCTVFASLVRGLWRGGRFAWRGGRYAVVKLSAAA